MFQYLFPIFCFGLVISAIVLLGVLEASKHLLEESARALDQEPRDLKTTTVSLPLDHRPRFSTSTRDE